jgi:hypothetical protein
MSRRKGELSPSGIDRGWPYQIAVPDHLMRRKPFDEWLNAQRRLNACPRGHNVYFQGETWHIVCFAAPEEALAFKAEFGGVNFDPADRGKGHSWAKWRRPFAEPPLGGYRK